MTIPCIANSKGLWCRWHVWCPPFKENDPRQAPVSEVDLNAHLIRTWSGDYIFREGMHHEIQVGPGEFSVQGRHYADSAEPVKLMVVVVTTRNVCVWMPCCIWLYGDENGFEEGDYLPWKDGATTKCHGQLERGVVNRIRNIGSGKTFN